VTHPEGNQIPKSLYLFRKQFSSLSSQMTQFYYCSECKNLISNKDSHTNCRGTLKKSMMLRLPSCCLQEKVSCPDFVKKTSYRRHFPDVHGTEQLRHHHVEFEKKLSDIYDGVRYKNIASHITNKPGGLSATLGTDGGSPFKSSKYKIWPIFMHINELSPEDRGRPENVLFCGFWYGQDDPDFNSIFKVLTPDLIKLRDEGIPIHNPITKRKTVWKLVILVVVVDIPAHRKFFYMKSFNGFHGCSICEAPGQRINNSNYYPEPDGRPYPLRTEKSISDAYSECNHYTDIKGVMDVPVFCKDYRSMISLQDIGSMHTFYEGVVRHILDFWTNSQYSDQPWYVSPEQRSINIDLMKQRLPAHYHSLA